MNDADVSVESNSNRNAFKALELWNYDVYSTIHHFDDLMENWFDIYMYIYQSHSI